MKRQHPSKRALTNPNSEFMLCEANEARYLPTYLYLSLPTPKDTFSIQLKLLYLHCMSYIDASTYIRHSKRITTVIRLYT